MLFYPFWSSLIHRFLSKHSAGWLLLSIQLKKGILSFLMLFLYFTLNKKWIPLDSGVIYTSVYRKLRVIIFFSLSHENSLWIKRVFFSFVLALKNFRGIRLFIYWFFFFSGENVFWIFNAKKPHFRNLYMKTFKLEWPHPTVSSKLRPTSN